MCHAKGTEPFDDAKAVMTAQFLGIPLPTPVA